MILVNSTAMQGADRRAIDEVGISEHALMELAANAVVREVVRCCAERPRHALVLVGPGNNGGDGLAVARRLLGLGWSVRVRLLPSPEALTGATAEQHGLLQRATPNLDCTRIGGGPGLLADLIWASVIVDGLFGTGLSRPVEGPVARVVDAVNGSGTPVIAIDIPSGVDASSGAILGAAIQAHTTVTFAVPKMGHYLTPGRWHRGRLVVADIGIVVLEQDASAQLLTQAQIAQWLPRRTMDQHKGQGGHTVVMGGSIPYLGAATMAGLGAVASGAALVTLSVHSSLAKEARMGYPGLMVASGNPEAPGWPRGKVASLVIGPGWGDEGLAYWFAVVMGDGPWCGLPTVFDADALNILAHDPGLRACDLPLNPSILTPHTGEAARLLAMSAEQVLENRVAAARVLAEKHRAVVVLKGPSTLIAAPDGRLAVNPTGHPLLAQGGTGDVLAGIIGGLQAQGMASFEAACCGTFLHGWAAERLAEHQGESGLRPELLAQEVGHLRGQVERWGQGSLIHREHEFIPA
ncbi:MAG: bifunctional ADP-dependent NAD(P)H-hydrate dehydratase/NAD(P)H-hydrate epimerase [Alphaproteobacteria bacterium CG_4_10_14_0_2_um_filter_63_37]|nr:MAG: hypothetical protein AUJ55_07680 [Proteobacteria bacterium CG1_02_64_396]PJA24449.1 MAG: bifunctional ADP-dependent NAD(P)H-hydrate dehydratase/NAD(P)H-hydrate epimerase [Alphaproteobacteria bacterium CG_4_10_14_0_2_um_filter_63_37]